MRMPNVVSLALLLAGSLIVSTSPVLAAGNPEGDAPIPPEARAVDTSRPDRNIGNGKPASCTSKRVVQAVAKGGVIRFRCGKKPITIKMKATGYIRGCWKGRTTPSAPPGKLRRSG